MNLRLRTLLASSIATIVLVTGLSAGLSYLVLRQIAQIEAKTMSRRLDQTMESLVDDLEIPTNSSSELASDQPKAPGSVRTQINSDVEIVRDRSGKLLPHNSNNSLQGAKWAVSGLPELANLPAQWVSLPTVKPIPLPRGVQVGLVQTSEGVLLLAERPWSPRKGEPLRLITGQWLSTERLQILGNRTLLRLRLLSVDDPRVPAQLRAGQSGDLRAIADYSLKSDPPLGPPPALEFVAPPQDPNFRDRPPLPLQAKGVNGPSPTRPEPPFPQEATQFIAGYALLRDVGGKPIAVLQAVSPKPFTEQAEAGIKTLLAFLWVTVLIFGIVFNFLLDRWVLVRIDHLSRQLKRVKADLSRSTQVSLPGTDELSDLASDINAMLQRQERYQENLRLAKAEVAAANRELEQLATTDGLTQVMNRRFFQLHLEESWQQALQTARPLALLLCDVDFFKLYNDTYGHLAGDLCLQKVAKAMAAVLEPEPAAVMARYGGEEFAAILSDRPIKSVIALAEQMRTNVLQLNLPHAGSKAADCVTVSIGVCSLIPQPHLSYRDLIARADEYLYQAKAEGRNRVMATLTKVNTLQADARQQ